MDTITKYGRLLAVLVLLAAVTVSNIGEAFAASGGTPQASITLSNCNSELCNANNTDWSLDKTPHTQSVTSSTISWTVTGTRGATTDNFITVNGVMTVTNTGTANATIGNIVINLQKPAVKNAQKVPWVSVAADCADATSGDGATKCNIVAAASQENPTVDSAQGVGNYTVSGARGTFTETPSVSGTLEFTDANSNTVFSLTPQVSLAPNQSLTLLYTATFDNTVLNLPVGSQVRAEAIVSFGNAGARGGSGASASNIDVNGDNIINSDETYVRSVPCRVTESIPALQNGNDTVALSDLFPDDVAVAGTGVSVGNPSGFGSSNISATTSVDPSVDEVCTPPGAATINNTAHLDGDSSTVTVQGLQIGTDPLTGLPIYAQYTFACVTGVDLDASANAGVTCEEELPPGKNACTYTQGGYQGRGTPGQIFNNNFSTVFASGLTIGINDGAGSKHDALWTAAAPGPANLQTFLAGGGPSGALTADTTNATSVSGGALAEQTAALALNVGFALDSTSAVGAGNFAALQVCNTGTSADGRTVADILADANTTLGDGNVCSNNAAIPCDPGANGNTIHSLCGSTSAQCVAKTLPTYAGSASILNDLVTNLNASFDNCSASAFANANLCTP